MGFSKVFKVKAERIKVKCFKCFVCTMASLLLLSATATSSKAQTFDEWFKQNSTQIKYLGLQIAALAELGIEVKHGYSVAKAGLTTIGNYTGMEYGLHGDYFGSLKAVSPAVKNDSDLPAIRADQQEIIAAFNGLPSLSALTISEQAYVASVRSGVLADCGRDMDELTLVVTPGKLELTDDERLKRLHRVYLSMQDRRVFARAFSVRVALLTGQRVEEQSGCNTLNHLYGID
jgi:hypothetical protein